MAALLTAVAFEFPAKAPARVNDFADLLDEGARRTIEATLAAYETESSTQIVVATVPSLDGGDIDETANRLFEKWGLGQKGKNNGVLLLIAVRDRKARIEVGYGLEDRLTDALSRRILEERLFPAFRNGRYAEGVASACAGIVEATRGAYLSPGRGRSGRVPLGVVLAVGLILVILLIVVQRGGSIGPRGRSRSYRTGPVIWGGGWGGGGLSGGGGWGGGGGFSGGGGISGGGGASGSW